jgi:hypothetical protein
MSPAPTGRPGLHRGGPAGRVRSLAEQYRIRINNPRFAAGPTSFGRGYQAAMRDAAELADKLAGELAEEETDDDGLAAPCTECGSRIAYAHVPGCSVGAIFLPRREGEEPDNEQRA